MCEAADMLMKMGERIGEVRGREAGKAIGEARVNTLNQKLIQAKRYADLERSAQDEEYQKKLYQEFGL